MTISKVTRAEPFAIFKITKGEKKRFLLLALLISASAIYPAATSAEPFFQDSFESGDRNTTMNGFRWADSTGVVVTSDRAKSGNYSLRFRFEGNTDPSGDAWAELRYFLGNEYDDLWLQYYLYVPDNYYHRKYSGETSNNKGAFTIWSGSYGPSSSGAWVSSENWANSGNSIPSLFLGSNGNNYGHYNFTWRENFIRVPEDRGKWIQVTAHIKLTTALDGADGYVGLWRDGELVMEGTNLDFFATDGRNYLDRGYLLGWSNSGFDETTDMYIDDIIFSTTAISMKVAPKPITDLR